MNTKLILGFILGLAFFILVGVLFPSLLTSTFSFFAKTRLSDVSVDPVGSKKDSFLISFKSNRSITINSFVITKHCDDAHLARVSQEEFNSANFDPLLLLKLRDIIDENRVLWIQKIEINGDVLANTTFRNGIQFDKKMLLARTVMRNLPKIPGGWQSKEEEKIRFPNPKWNKSLDSIWDSSRNSPDRTIRRTTDNANLDKSLDNSSSNTPRHNRVETDYIPNGQRRSTDRKIAANPNSNYHHLPPTWYYYEIFVVYNGTNIRSLRFFGRPENDDVLKIIDSK